MKTEYEPTNSQLLKMRKEIIEKLSRREVLKRRSFPATGAAMTALILLLAVAGIHYQAQEHQADSPVLTLKSGPEEHQNLCRLKIYSFQENRLILLDPGFAEVSRPEDDTGVFVPVLNCSESDLRADIVVTFDGVRVIKSAGNPVTVLGADQELCMENREDNGKECKVNYLQADPEATEIKVRAEVFKEDQIAPEIHTQTIHRSSRK